MDNDSILDARAEGGGVRGSGAFSQYDRVEHNSLKSMSFVYGANHNGFIGFKHNDPGSVTHSNLDVSIQVKIAKGYFNAFLRWHLMGEEEFKPYFTGELIPRSIGLSLIHI